MHFTFSQLPDNRLEEAFQVFQTVTAHIESMGRKQRISTSSLDTFRRWQAEKANFIVLECDAIVGLVTVRREILEHWPDFIELGSVWMLRALATSPKHTGKGIGAFAVRETIKRIGVDGPLFLDCVSDFLPGYYGQFGFERIARQDCVHSDGKTYDITLMRYERS